MVNAPADIVRWRFYAIAALLGLMALALIARLAVLQVVDVERGYRFLQSQGNARTTRTEVIPAHRGQILDRNGEPLAISTPVVSLWADPRELADSQQEWPQLAKALGMPLKDLKARIAQHDGRAFMYLRRHVPPQDAAQILERDYRGVYGRQEYRRFYPAGEVAAHVLGFTNIDDAGQEGLELAFDEWLRGEPGAKRVLKDLRGRVIRDIDAGRMARPGNDLMLSIDLRLQHMAYRELKAALARYDAKAGSIVLLDNASGEVLAMVNQPSFNPNDRSQRRPATMRNRAITDQLEPGSTMKPLTMVAALESGQYSIDTVINTSPGWIRVGGKTLLDPVNYGPISLTTVLAKSSQVGTSKVALSLDMQALWGVFERFGLGRSTGSGFPGENSGVLPNRERWRPIEQATFAFGYGMTATPLQMAQAYGVFANRGEFVPATLLKRQEPVEGQRVVAAPIAEDVVKML
ncbi:MAG: penicillin-binding transpeptidase domain-containing protein, partial [Spongiibacteraceae bacterium]|nr:penicillin-binding transpeptidase domain-containing protein [Spongiibacteraceae bacterium]